MMSANTMGGGRVTAISTLAGVEWGRQLPTPKALLQKTAFSFCCPSLSITDANVLLKHNNYYLRGAGPGYCQEHRTGWSQ
jgi:hypothetical protein